MYNGLSTSLLRQMQDGKRCRNSMYIRHPSCVVRNLSSSICVSSTLTSVICRASHAGAAHDVSCTVVAYDRGAVLLINCSKQGPDMAQRQLFQGASKWVRHVECQPCRRRWFDSLWRSVLFREPRRHCANTNIKYLPNYGCADQRGAPRS